MNNLESKEISNNDKNTQISEKVSSILENVDISTNTDQSQSQSIYSSDFMTNKLKHYSYKEFMNLEFPPNTWLVKDLIPKDGITCISGQPKVGKSIVALNLAISLVTNQKWLEYFEVEQSSVLYISKDEPATLTQQRLKEMMQNNGIEDLPLTFITEKDLLLENNSYVNYLIKIIKEKKVSVLIIDSFRRIFTGDENSSQVISSIQNKLRAFSDLGVTIIFIHHHGKEGFFFKVSNDKLRGSSDILAMLDSHLLLDKPSENQLRITNGALRMAQNTAPFLIEMDGLKLKFIEFTAKEKGKKDLAQEDILNLLKNDLAKKLSQTEIIEKLVKKGNYAKTTIKNALRILEETKQVTVETDGKKKNYKQLVSN